MQTPDLRNETQVSAPGASDVGHTQTTLGKSAVDSVSSVSKIGKQV